MNSDKRFMLDLLRAKTFAEKCKLIGICGMLLALTMGIFGNYMYYCIDFRLLDAQANGQSIPPAAYASLVMAVKAFTFLVIPAFSIFTFLAGYLLLKVPAQDQKG